jgi:hypothetical protein
VRRSMRGIAAPQTTDPRFRRSFAGRLPTRRHGWLALVTRWLAGSGCRSLLVRFLLPLSLIPGLRSLVGPVGIEPATKDS